MRRLEKGGNMGKLTSLAVGVPVPQFKNRPDGVILNFTDGGMMIMQFLNMPTEKEISSFKSGQALQLSYYFKEGMFFLLMKAGELNWADAPYNPYLPGEMPDIPEITQGSGIALTLMLIDSATGAPVSMRLIGLPHDFSKDLKRVFEKMKDNQMDPQMYDAKIQLLMRLYSTKQLLGLGNKPIRIRENNTQV